ncbi:DUF6297 family protein [Actinoalloteichus hymeniacidonis]|uniref:Uncharacterized protein n=1 Tax=Actinoalloteichus hymeniacidonis TaxID=340345 RepID=A0AAC9HRY9_9PSEU|nr:DUF6297 family protein [Actinoalloteichus hymeniacidonis]AOS64353.1 hypothetical protein TL08_17765 [Actinoalloteichus hymeniacidonis]MBB5907579.1 hypothetical protein [Actinoalloteichus hymeniacidonis]
MSTTTDGVGHSVSAAHLRTLLRQRRRHRISATTRMGRIYEGLLYTVILGGLLVQLVWAAMDWSQSAETPADPHGRAWLLAGITVTFLGLLFRVLADLGPLSASATSTHWIFSTPVDRGALLRPRMLVSTAAAALVSLVPVSGAALSTQVAGADLLGMTLIGALIGVIGFGQAVTAQSIPRGPRLVRVLGSAVAAVGTLLAGGSGLATVLDLALPGLPALPWLAASIPVAVLALWSLRSAARSVGLIDRTMLTDSAELTGTVRLSVGWMDTGLFADIMEARRWRRRGTVVSHRLAAHGVPALLRAELRRALRRRSSIGWWAALAAVPYVAATMLPALWTMPVALVVGFFAVGRLSAGLRLTARSGALRRMLPFSDLTIRLTMLAAPAIGALLWGAATAPAVEAVPWWSAATAIALVGLAGVLRSAMRPPPDYNSGATLDPVMGAVPVYLIVQLIAGPDIVVACTLLAIAGVGPLWSIGLAVLAIGWALFRDRR